MKISYVSILTDADQQKALEFYTQKLGFQVKVDVPVHEQWRWIALVSPESPDGTQLSLEPGVDEATAARKKSLYERHIPLTAFEVEDIKAEYQRLTGLGVAFGGEPQDMGMMRAAQLDDTCGNRIQIFQMK